MFRQNLLAILRGGTSAVALSLMIAAGVATAVTAVTPTPVFADDSGDGGANGNPGNGGQGHGGQGNGGQANGGQGNGGQGNGGQPPGTGPEPGESDGRGPHYGQPVGNTGGKPVWAQEGIPEVELGRLNVARAPVRVLLQAYDEALSSLTDEMAVVYNMSVDELVELFTYHWDDVQIIDSPLQNLALLQDALDGTSVLNDSPLIDNDVETLMALFLGLASDKTVEISRETVIAVATILGYTLDPSMVTQLAQDAEAIREAVLIGHG